MASRFDEFRNDGDLPPLRKLEIGEKFTALLQGVRPWTPPADQQNPDPKPLPVLDLEEANVRYSWMASTWHAIDQLTYADPADGDTVRVTRLPNRGRSHQYQVEVVTRRTPPESDTPIDDSGLPDLPKPTGGEQFGEVPF
jgi:hypothetical protein